MQKFHAILSVGAPHMRAADVAFKSSNTEGITNLSGFQVQDEASLTCLPLSHGLASLRDQ